MNLLCKVVLCTLSIESILAVDVKVVMHSEQDDSKGDDVDLARIEPIWDKKVETTLLPFIKHRHRADKATEFEESFTTERSQIHPNEMIFPLIYKQKHINSMFKYGEHWYTWAIEKRTDGSTIINYYTCNDEPKKCDEVGWVSHL